MFTVQIPGKAIGYLNITLESILEAGLNNHLLIVIPALLFLKIQNETPVPGEGFAQILWQLAVLHLYPVPK